IDVLAERGYPDACWMMMTLLQCIKSARWPGDHPLSIMPGVSPELEDDNTNTTQNKKQAIPSTLMDLVSLRASATTPLVKTTPSLAPPTRDHLTNALPYPPRLDVSVADPSASGLTVHLTRHAPLSSSSPAPKPSPDDPPRIYAPRFPKPQS